MSFKMKSLALLALQDVTREMSLSELVEVVEATPLYKEIADREVNLWKDAVRRMGSQGEDIVNSRLDLETGDEWMKLCKGILKGKSYSLATSRKDVGIPKCRPWSLIPFLERICVHTVEGLLPASNTPGYQLNLIQSPIQNDSLRTFIRRSAPRCRRVCSMSPDDR